jgi:ADP-ribose pyrophosphatase YjhB (NUDIX family)
MDGQTLLLWRHRFITGSQGWEIPIGKIEPGEDPATAAARETEEETGWRPGPLHPLLRVEPSPGLSDSAHSIYLADGAKRIGSPEDDFESDSVSWVPLASVPSLIGRGDITSGTTLAALLYVLAGGIGTRDAHQSQTDGGVVMPGSVTCRCHENAPQGLDVTVRCDSGGLPHSWIRHGQTSAFPHVMDFP